MFPSAKLNSKLSAGVLSFEFRGRGKESEVLGMDKGGKREGARASWAASGTLSGLP